MIDIQKYNSGLLVLENFHQQNSGDILNLCNEGLYHEQNESLSELFRQTFTSNSPGYAHPYGYYPLRELISSQTEAKYSYIYQPDSEVTITAGASGAIATAIAAFVKEGDEVIIFEPSYFTYAPLVLANGGRPTYIRLKLPGMQIDWDEVQKGITVNTKMIIVNTPHNPSGYLMSAQDMERLTRIVKGTKIIILSDESFDTMVFEGYEHQSIARFPQLAERAVVVFSVGKSLLFEGLKVGYCVAPQKLSEKIRRYHLLFSMSVSLPLQEIALELLKNKTYHHKKFQFLESNRNILLNGLKNTQLKVIPSSGTYFQNVNYSALSDKKDVDYCKFLLENYSLSVMPFSYFYHDSTDLKMFRICFSVRRDALEKALSILSTL